MEQVGGDDHIALEEERLASDHEVADAVVPELVEVSRMASLRRHRARISLTGGSIPP
jgi:hypothetical protein